MRVCSWLCSLVLLATVFGLSGCGWLADPDRVAIAEMDGKPIRMLDINKHLREMLDAERPFIKTRGDLRRVLQEYIDTAIKKQLADSLPPDAVTVPREIAAARFDARHPDFRATVEMGEKMGMSEAERNMMRDERERRIDLLHEKLRGEAALIHAARKALGIDAPDGQATMEITDEEFRNEYEALKEELFTPETVLFDGVYFPRSQDGAAALASSAFTRAQAGESMTALAAEFAAAGTGFPINSGIQNDPALAFRYGTFWEQAAGASAGDVVGPIFISGWEAARQGANGQSTAVRIPDAFLVCKIVRSQPPAQMSMTEARPMLAPRIASAKMIEKLRDEHGVKIHEDRIPNPGGHRGGGPRSIFDEKRGGA
jgi:hypothetical protein